MSHSFVKATVNHLCGQVNWVGWSLRESPVQGKQCQPGMVPAVLCGSEGEGLREDNSLCQQTYLGESCPLALTLMPDTSVPPHMSLVPCKLLPRCRNE